MTAPNFCIQCIYAPCGHLAKGIHLVPECPPPLPRVVPLFGPNTSLRAHNAPPSTTTTTYTHIPLPCLQHNAPTPLSQPQSPSQLAHFHLYVLRRHISPHYRIYPEYSEISVIGGNWFLKLSSHRKDGKDLSISRWFSCAWPLHSITSMCPYIIHFTPFSSSKAHPYPH